MQLYSKGGVTRPQRGFEKKTEKLGMRRLCRLRIITRGSTTLAFVRSVPKSLQRPWRGIYDEEKEDTHQNSQGNEQRVALCKCIRGGTPTEDGKKCNGRQRDSKREKKKKSRPLVVKAPSRPLRPAVSLFRSFFLPLSPSHADSFSTVAAVRGSFAEVEAKQLEWP